MVTDGPIGTYGKAVGAHLGEEVEIDDTGGWAGVQAQQRHFVTFGQRFLEAIMHLTEAAGFETFQNAQGRPLRERIGETRLGKAQSRGTQYL
jgi:hypothetical protein